MAKPPASTRGWCVDRAQGRRSPLARTRAIRRGHRVARHAGGCVPAQSTRPCPHRLDLHSARCTGAGLHCGRTAADQADPGGHAGTRCPFAAVAAARHRQGALCRRGDCGLRRPDARRSRRPRRRRHRRLRAARRGGRRAHRASRQPRLCARILRRQPVSGEDDRRWRHRSRGARRRDHHQPRIPHQPAVRRVNGVPRCAGVSRPPARRGRGLCLDPDAAHHARRARRNPRDRGTPHQGCRARCRRWLWAQGPAVSRGDHPGRAGAGTRPSGAVDRGSQRTSADLRAFARPSLPGHGVCRSAGSGPRRRLRDHRRCRRLWHVAARSLSGSQHGSALFSRAPTRSRIFARGPGPSRPTRRRSARIAASAVLVPALRSSG